jgi:hypothetical protein
MEKIKLALSSRTFWAIVVLFIFNGITAIRNAVPPEYQVYVDGVLSLGAIYYKLNPSQQY